jgi:hypothetical protein
MLVRSDNPGPEKACHGEGLARPICLSRLAAYVWPEKVATLL